MNLSLTEVAAILKSFVKPGTAGISADPEFFNSPHDVLAQLPRTLAELASPPDDAEHAVRLAMHDVYRREAQIHALADEYENARFEFDGEAAYGRED